ncbi:hypothetical protein [Bizionia myxarmorum]|uniref:Uncharacterized protein n=1 Tax=Bizionia myxarmorum TaxID=291186 RepID=A0A5D0RET3_9FLAO|nr:hypothetical protein [Bizionia myxarmorum]TYB79208.1 hypothetical protein ES674_05380 [Bizionia myxarmorum]
MKLAFTIIIILFFFQSTSAQENIYIDENGKIISSEAYSEKLRNQDLSYSKWLHIDENGDTHYTLTQGYYSKGVFDYFEIKSEIENLINRKIPDSNTILIEYRYKDDLCTARRDNKWTKDEILDRKNFLNPLRTDIEKNKITFIVLFENGMTLRNRPHKKDEYFYIDSNNFFRNKIFIKPTWCGSYALIKPNGETLIRNGEYRPDWMAEHLKNVNWKLFFDSKN